MSWADEMDELPSPPRNPHFLGSAGDATPPRRDQGPPPGYSDSENAATTTTTTTKDGGRDHDHDYDDYPPPGMASAPRGRGGRGGRGGYQDGYDGPRRGGRGGYNRSQDGHNGEEGGQRQHQHREPRPPREPVPLPTEAPFTAYVGNLPYEAAQDELNLFLEDHGCRVRHVRLLEDRQTGRPRGYGYVEFENIESLKTALALNGTEFMARVLRVDVASSRDNDSSAAGAGGGRGGARRGRGGNYNNNSDRPPRREYGSSGFGARSDGGHDTSAPVQRPKLNLAPRTVDANNSNAAGVASTDSAATSSPSAPKKKADPFGTRPRDEKEYQARKAKELEEREQKAREDKDKQQQQQEQQQAGSASSVAATATAPAPATTAPAAAATSSSSSSPQAPTSAPASSTSPPGQSKSWRDEPRDPAQRRRGGGGGGGGGGRGGGRGGGGHAGAQGSYGADSIAKKERPNKGPAAPPKLEEAPKASKAATTNVFALLPTDEE